MKTYELVLILHPDAEVDLPASKDKLAKLLESAAKILQSDDWGKRKLAYPIAKQSYGIYLFYKLEVEPQNIAKISEALNIEDTILRYLVSQETPVPSVKEAKSAKTAKVASKSGATDNKEKADMAKKGK